MLPDFRIVIFFDFPAEGLSSSIRKNEKDETCHAFGNAQDFVGKVYGLGVEVFQEEWQNFFRPDSDVFDIATGGADSK